MPLYEFQCKNCGLKLEQLCKACETGEQMVCPHCKDQGLRRLVSSFSAPGVKGGQDKCAACKGGNCGNC